MLSISQFLSFSNLISNTYFEVSLVTCQDGWVVRALDYHARDPWFKSHWQQAFLLRKGFQKFFKKWLSPMWKWWDISSSSIMAISSLDLKSSEFWFWKLSIFQNWQILLRPNIRDSKIVKMAFCVVFKSLKLISRKIWVAFH